ncbi:MAG: hypothetical protein PVG14_03085 [Anaerolineales bacterium]|jgi:hypothetical protein
MSDEGRYRVGDLIVFSSGERRGVSGIVSQPITGGEPGHVLILQMGHINGVEASFEEVIPADESYEGFAQLAYNLIKLGSHVIEKRLI